MLIQQLETSPQIYGHSSAHFFQDHDREPERDPFHKDKIAPKIKKKSQ